MLGHKRLFSCSIINKDLISHETELIDNINKGKSLNEKKIEFKSLKVEEEENNTNGRWNENEQKMFIEACFLYGNNWRKVS